MLIKLMLFVIFSAALLLSALVVSRNYRSRKNQYFTLFSLSVAAWTIGIERFLSASEMSLLRFWSGWYYIAAAAIASTLMIYVVHISKSRHKFWIILSSLTSLIAISSAVIFADNFPIFQPEIENSARVAEINPIPYFLYSLYFVFNFFGALIILLSNLKKASGFELQQLQVLFTGVLLSGILGVFFNLILPFAGNYSLIWAGPLGLIIFLAVIGYGIVQHKLFDVRLVVARSLAYVLLLATLLGLYAIVLFGVSSILIESNNYSRPEQILNVIAAIVLAFTFQPLKRFFDRITNSIFYRDAYYSESVIRQINDVVLSSLALEGLLFGVVKTLSEELRLKFGVIGVKQVKNVNQTVVTTNDVKFDQTDIDFVRRATTKFDQRVVLTDELPSGELRSILRKYDIDVLARIVADPNSDDDGLGYVALGPKRSGSLYSNKDIELLDLIASELVVAVQNALRFEEISQFNEQLTQRVDEATKELQAKNQKLRKLDEAKDDFISMASHQLRTPLTTVKGYLSMLDDGDLGKLSKKQQEVIELAFASSERMVYLISDLLNASRINTGKFVIEKKPIKLKQIIQSEIDQLSITAESRDISIKAELGKQDPTVKLDAGKLRQVIMNLIDNAIYYSEPDSEITVSYEVSSDEVEFKVIDSGIGVPEDAQGNLFTKFYRAENAKRVRPDGTGLGLFLAKKVISAQGGSVLFESTPSQGSTFGFRFALASVVTTEEPSN